MMHDLQQIWNHLKEIPEYWPAMVAAATILLIGAPVYAAMWYFMYRRKIKVPGQFHFALVGVFAMFATLAFFFASPLADRVHSILVACLFVTCVLAAYCIVVLLEIFFIEYYLIEKRKTYISPPMRKIISMSVFCLALLPILRYVLHLNPFTLVAIPTIATAGIALALQDTLKALIAGVGLGHFIKVGEWIAVQDKEGRVMDISWGRTVLRTVDGDMLYIPNTLLLTQPFLNYSANQAHRMMLKVVVAMTATPERVKKAMEQCIENIPGVAAFPAPTALVLSFENYGVQYGLSYWIEEYGNRFAIQDKLSTQLMEAFRKEGFEMPFAFPTYPMSEGFHPVSQEKTDFRRGSSAPAKDVVAG